MTELVKIEKQSPTTVQDSADRALAERAMKSGLLPESIETPEAAMLIIAKGREIGIGGMASFKHMYVIKGQVGMDSALIAYLFERRGHSFIPIKRTAEECSIRFYHRNGATYTHTLTRAEVTKARWDQYKKNDTYQTKDQWLKMPEVMLYYRTLTTGIRMVDPGCLLGVRSDDELMDVDDSEFDADNTEHVEGQVTELETGISAAEGGDPQNQQPEPNAGWATWNDIKKRAFLTAHRKAGLTEAQIFSEYNVQALDEWPYSVNQTRPVLELLALFPDITIAEKKKALGIEHLCEIVWYGWSCADCEAVIRDAIGASR